MHQTAECSAVDNHENQHYLEKEEQDMKDLIGHFQDLRVADLRAELRKWGLKTDGRKGDLKRRLSEAVGITQDVISNQEPAKLAQAEVP